MRPDPQDCAPGPRETRRWCGSRPATGGWSARARRRIPAWSGRRPASEPSESIERIQPGLHPPKGSAVELFGGSRNGPIGAGRHRLLRHPRGSAWLAFLIPVRPGKPQMRKIPCMRRAILPPGAIEPRSRRPEDAAHASPRAPGVSTPPPRSARDAWMPPTPSTRPRRPSSQTRSRRSSRTSDPCPRAL